MSNLEKRDRLVIESIVESGTSWSQGHALDWHEPGWGRFQRDVPHTYCTREVTAVPGAAQLELDPTMQPWAAMRKVAVDLLAVGAARPGIDAFELRYIAEPQDGAGTRVRLFLTAKTRDWAPNVPQDCVDAARGAFPAAFEFDTPRADVRAGDPTRGQTIYELRRHETVTVPQYDWVPADFFYTIDDNPGDGSGWGHLIAALARVDRAVSASLLFHQTHLHFDERDLVTGIITELERYGSPFTDFDVLGRQITMPADSSAAIARDSWRLRLANLSRPMLWRAAVRGESSTALSIATALASAIAHTQPSAASPRTVPMFIESPTSSRDEQQAEFGFDFLEITPWGGHPIWSDAEAPTVLRRLPYLFGVDEAASLAVLPVPDSAGCPGFPRARRNSGQRSTLYANTLATEPGILLGRVIHHGAAQGSAVLPLSAVNRHVVVVGTPGSGKTTTVLSMLAALWREHRIPFLAIEPTKTEYRALTAMSGMQDVQVVTFGREDISPIRLNVLSPPPGVPREVHSSSVMATLKLAMPLPPPLPQLLEEALDAAYLRAGWEDETRPEDGIAPPTLRDVLICFDRIFQDHGYVGEARNVGTALRVRLGSLLRGSRGRVLDTVESTDFAALLATPTVIELDSIADADEKAILSAFVLDRVRAHARRRGSSGGQLRHVTVLEEAHRLLARTAGSPSAHEFGEDARAGTVKAFVEAIAELRSTGEGFLLCSQRPSDLADAAVANCGSRIIHRLESAADRRTMLDDLDADNATSETAARLRQGEAVVRWADQDEPETVKVTPADGVDSARVLTDDDLASRAAVQRAATRSLLPMSLCTRDVCSRGCEPFRRREGKQIADEVATAALEGWALSGANPQGVASVAAVVAAEAGADVSLGYCAAAHLAASGQVLAIKRDVDLRPHIFDAIRKAAPPDGF